MKKYLKIIIVIVSVFIFFVFLVGLYMGLRVFIGVKGAKSANDEAIKEIACVHTNIYLRKYFEKNKEYPLGIEQWVPENILKEKPRYNPVYKRINANSFNYTVTLNSGKKFKITEKDLFQVRDSNVQLQCRKWLQSL